MKRRGSLRTRSIIQAHTKPNHSSPADTAYQHALANQNNEGSSACAIVRCPRSDMTDPSMPLQCATQWDALSHIYFDGKMYNDRGPEQVTSNGARSNAITVLKDKIVSRGVLLDIPRPPGSERQLQHALPFAIEDQVVAPIETQHVAWAVADNPSRQRVAVVARSTLEAWLAPLRAA